jgi:hypothetical protein
VAVLRKAESASGDVWSTPTVDAACRKALHGHGHELARVTLAPVSPEVAASLGDAFMAMCAPAAYFFPITDVLNVTVIQTQPTFHLAELTGAGMSARYDRFETRLDRLGVAIVAASPGGRVTLSALDGHTATVDWTPEPMQISIVRHAAAGAPEVTLRGEERFAFRLEIDPASGALRRAATTGDTLDLVVTMPGVPADKAPHIAITREVTIEPRD